MRENRQGEESLWIPVETTLVSHGFETAWNTAALNYLKEAKISNGLIDRWVQIFDVN